MSGKIKNRRPRRPDADFTQSRWKTKVLGTLGPASAVRRIEPTNYIPQESKLAAPKPSPRRPVSFVAGSSPLAQRGGRRRPARHLQPPLAQGGRYGRKITDASGGAGFI